MTAKPDIIWNEQCLGIRVGEQVCMYLKKHDMEYQRLQKEILKLIERYPVIETFMESNQSISLTTEEHKAVHRYFQLENGKEMIEEQYHFYMDDGWISEEHMEDWENQYQAYHSLGENGILDSRRAELLKLPNRKPNKEEQDNE